MWKQTLTLFLLCCTCFADDEAWMHSFDGRALSDRIRAEVESALKADAMQSFIDSLTLERRSISEESLDMTLQKIGSKFEKRTASVQKLREKIAEAYSNGSDDEAKNCCDIDGLRYNPAFKAQVDVGDLCKVLNPAFDDDVFYNLMLRGVRDQCVKNLKDIPSLKWQYFTSEKGNTFVYPAVHFSTCDDEHRFKPWYVRANTPKPKQVVIALDSSGTMGRKHNGVPLIQIAVEAAKTVVRTLNPHDKFAVLSFNDVTETIQDDENSCFSYRLAQATQLNKETVSNYLDNIKVQGGASYGKAIGKAFLFFENEHESGSASVTSAQRVILFLSDGKPEETRQNIIQQALIGHKALNNSVVIMTYGLGGADQFILRDLANANTEKQGEFTAIENPNQLRNEMGSFYKFFASESQNRSEPLWTLPYLDSLGLGDMLAAALPVFAGDELVGVTGNDLIFEDLFADSTFFKPNKNSYAFVIDGMGLVIHHPHYSHRDDNEAVYILATTLEEDEEFLSVFESMKSGGNGSKSFMATKVVRETVHSNSLYKKIKILSTYTWRKIPHGNFSICFVFTDFENEVKIPHQDHLPSGSFLYHRLDLEKPQISCQHLRVYSAAGQSSVYLSARAFQDPHYFLFLNFTRENVQAIIKFMEENGENSLGIRELAKNEVIITHRAFKLWTEDDSATSKSHILWRYVATNHGVFRIYPAAQMPENFDPLRTPWFQYATENRNITTRSHRDLLTGATVITFYQTLFNRRTGVSSIDDGVDEPLGVMGMDVFAQYFSSVFEELYSEWTSSDDSMLHLIDSSGFAVWSHQKVFFGAPEHLTMLEPEISRILIKQGILERRACSVLHAGMLQRQYKISLRESPWQGKYIISDKQSCFGFSLVTVTQTDLFLLMKIKITCDSSFVSLPSTKCSCSPSKCTTNWEEDNACECPCLDRNPYFNACSNQYDHTNEFSSQCSPKEESHSSKVSDSIDTSELPACYKLLVHKEQDYTTVIIILAIAIPVFALMLLGGFADFYARILPKIKLTRAKRRAVQDTTTQLKKSYFMKQQALASSPDTATTSNRASKRFRSRFRSSISETRQFLSRSLLRLTSSRQRSTLSRHSNRLTPQQTN